MACEQLQLEGVDVGAEPGAGRSCLKEAIHHRRQSLAHHPTRLTDGGLHLSHATRSTGSLREVTPP
uniref:Uncharacterized protein n=1 Tax=Arundo donax TaxID=35708 RepID=A0A0A9A429_ARUDO